MSIKFRLARPDDAAAILAIYAPYCEASTVSFEVVAPTVEQMADRIEKVLARYPWLICELNGRAAGYVYASQHRERAAYRWAVDVAVYVADTCRRRGIGQALYSTLFAMLRVQGYFKALAGITLPNPGSVGLHEAMGFKPIAVYRGVGYKLGQWVDVGWWQLDLQPEIARPREPMTLSELSADPAIQQSLRSGELRVRPDSRQ
jgi:phosphinothricin acetyltransferase